jgi:S-DNA-T family DNA segregation ATPase FtsK/SpoIIIE
MQDQSAVAAFTDRSEGFKWSGKFGAYLANLFVYNGFGLASFLFCTFCFLLTGIYLSRKRNEN